MRARGLKARWLRICTCRDGVICGPMLLMAMACTISEDPAQGGILSGAVGLLGGGYNERVEQREKVLSQAQGTQAKLSERAAEIEAQRAAMAEELESVRRTIAGLSRRLAMLRTSLETETGARNEDRLRLAAAEARLAQAKKQFDDLQSDQIDTTVDRLPEIRELRSVLNGVGRLVRAISDTPNPPST